MRERAETAEILPAVVAGDRRARLRLLELWGPVVLRWCARLGGPGIDEEDAAHDVFEVVLARVHTVRSAEAFGAWLFQTTRRVLRGHRRRAWLRRWVPGLVPEVEDPSEGPGRDLEDAALVAGVQAVLDTLPPALREVLVLCEVEERDGAEVALLLGIPLGTVRSRLRRAREAFERQGRAAGLERYA